MPTQATILVCDDDPHVVFGTSRMLRKAGYNVLEAANGHECLELARNERPDMILLDWVMPDMEGPEVCRRLKADPDLEGMVIVLVSGSKISDEDRADGLEIGADSYMTHPLHSRSFLANVAALLRMRRAEQRLRESQRLAAIGTIAEGLGHEINNPLMGMIDYAELIRECYSDDDPDLLEYTNGIISGGKRVANIVRGLMGFAATDKEDSATESPREIVDKTLGLCEASIKSEGINIDISVASNLPDLEHGTGVARRILLTLLTNARESFQGAKEAMADTATIRITAQSDTSAETVQFSIEDNGPGIERENRDRVFEPFFTTKNRAEHTGLELGVARNLARELGGSLTLADSAAPWTSFSLELPVARHSEKES